jgi:L(+)-tartrate dehydratase beta subunit
MGSEREPAVVHLCPPLSEEDVRGLYAGDEVWLDGTVWGIRDATLLRLFAEGRRPVGAGFEDGAGFEGAVFLHTAPSVRKGDDGRYTPVSVGTTTSMRMDSFTGGCLELLGARAIIGKGGLSDESHRILQERTGVYLSITGGAASWQTLQIEEIEEVLWEDLMPECLWKFRVKSFGPLFVTMDCHGTSSYQQVRSHTDRAYPAAIAKLGL